MAAFEELGVLPEITKTLTELNWFLPTGVQAESIPLILGGGDVLMSAEKGLGKTAGYCLPLVQLVWETLWDIQNGRATTGNRTPPWKMSTVDRDAALSVAPGGLSVQSLTQPDKWQGVRCTRGLTSGKWGYEVTLTTEGSCRVGWSNLNAALDLGTDKFGWGFCGTGKKHHDKQLTDYGQALTVNDVLTCLLDMDNGEIRFLKNGEDMGVAFEKIDTSEAIFPAVTLKNSEMSFNFGEKPYKYSLPENFSSQIEAPKDKRAINSKAISGRSGNAVKLANKAPLALIIEPTRDLAERTCDQIMMVKKYLNHPAIKEMLIVGGVRIKDQIAILQHQGADIVIATPGRLPDFVDSGWLSLANCRFFILDDADGLISHNYINIIEKLHKMIPKVTADGKRLQTIACTSTLHSSEVKKMAEKLMEFPTVVDQKGEDAVPQCVYHVVVKIDPQKDRSWTDSRRHILTDGVHQHDVRWNKSDTPESLSEAVKILKGDYVLRAINEHDMEKAIIFCRTKLDCDNLEKFFNQSDRYRYSCVCFHGDRRPNERKGNFNLFKQNQVNFLICTDVAARFLDISGVPFIINFTLPHEKPLYLDRIGRAGTQKRMGLAISLVSTVPEKVWYHGDTCEPKQRGRNCWNSKLTEDGGCCVWLDEQKGLADIEEHLKTTIPQIDTDMKVPYSEVKGKLVYGQVGKQAPHGNHLHATDIEKLTRADKGAQSAFLSRFFPKASK